jgi:hypothetical protein
MGYKWKRMKGGYCLKAEDIRLWASRVGKRWSWSVAGPTIPTTSGMAPTMRAAREAALKQAVKEADALAYKSCEVKCAAFSRLEALKALAG